MRLVDPFLGKWLISEISQHGKSFKRDPMVLRSAFDGRIDKSATVEILLLHQSVLIICEVPTYYVQYVTIVKLYRFG